MTMKNWINPLPKRYCRTTEKALFLQGLFLQLFFPEPRADLIAFPISVQNKSGQNIKAEQKKRQSGRPLKKKGRKRGKRMPE